MKLFTIRAKFYTVIKVINLNSILLYKTFIVSEIYLI